MDGNIKKKKEILLMINKIKNPKLRAEFRKDIMKLIELKKKKAALDSAEFDEKLLRDNIKFKSNKLH